MDTVIGEGPCADNVGWDFVLLLPFSILGQCWQIFSAYIMWKEYDQQSSSQKEWHVALAGCLFFALGLGNMITTLKVYCSRIRRQQALKQQ
jgi:hypothetical protein